MSANLDRIGAIVERLLNRTLSPVEHLVLRQSWQGSTYSYMARHSAYGLDYVKEIGSQLWQELSGAIQQPVTKKNLRAALANHLPQEFEALWWECQQEAAQQELSALDAGSAQTVLSLPGEPLPLGSPLYVPRPPLEALAFAELDKPGCLLRIRAQRKLGKSSLLVRLRARAANRGYRSVYLDFQEADATVFASLDRCLRWFCANVTYQLELPLAIDDYWDAEVGSKVSCKLYFETYLLPHGPQPLALMLNEVNRIVEYPAIANDFFSMLRLWHEQGKQGGIWQQLRLVVSYSTEVLLTLNLNQSPFNVGLALALPPFSVEQARELAKRYGLAQVASAAGSQELAQLVTMVGGHPYLLGMAFHHLRLGTDSLAELLASAPTAAGIYRAHLRDQLAILHQRPDLRAALLAVLADDGATLEAIAAYQLEGMGLIVLQGNQGFLSCELYRRFFATQLGATSLATAPAVGVAGLTKVTGSEENPLILDRTTWLARLQQHWVAWQEAGEQLALLLCRWDHFNLYLKLYGTAAGDRSLQQLAAVLSEYASQTTSFLGRSGLDEFALLLPGCEAMAAEAIAAACGAAVEALAIPFEPDDFGGLPAAVLTASLGVAVGIPTAAASPEAMLAAASRALQASQRRGGNAVSVAAWPDAAAGNEYREGA